MADILNGQVYWRRCKIYCLALSRTVNEKQARSRPFRAQIYRSVSSPLAGFKTHQQLLPILHLQATARDRSRVQLSSCGLVLFCLSTRHVSRVACSLSQTSNTYRPSGVEGSYPIFLITKKPTRDITTVVLESLRVQYDSASGVGFRR